MSEIYTADHIRLCQFCPAKYYLRKHINPIDRVWVNVRSVLTDYNSALLQGKAWSMTQLIENWNKTAGLVGMGFSKEYEDLHVKIGRILPKYVNFVQESVDYIYASSLECSFKFQGADIRVYLHLLYRTKIEEESKMPGLRVLYLDTINHSKSDIVPSLIVRGYNEHFGEIPRFGPLLSIVSFNCSSGETAYIEPTEINHKRAGNAILSLRYITEKNLFFPSPGKKCINCEVAQECENMGEIVDIN